MREISVPAEQLSASEVLHAASRLIIYITTLVATGSALPQRQDWNVHWYCLHH
jgi:hypothetical protein